MKVMAVEENLEDGRIYNKGLSPVKLEEDPRPSVKELKEKFERADNKRIKELEKEIENLKFENEHLRTHGVRLCLTKSQDRTMKMFFGSEEVPHEVRCIWNDTFKGRYRVISDEVVV
jgi:hypothetical protein